MQIQPLNPERTIHPPIDRGRAALSFAFAGALTNILITVLGMLFPTRHPHSGLELFSQVLAAGIGGVFYWGCLGILYAHFAYKSGLDFSRRGARARIGAKTGAWAMGGLMFAVGVVSLPFITTLVAQRAHIGGVAAFFLLSFAVTFGTLIVALFAALHGAWVALLAGKLVHDSDR
jgi:hypothetical protein